MGLFEWLAPGVVRANRLSVVKNLVVLCFLLSCGAANAGWSYLIGTSCKTTVAEVGQIYLSEHNHVVNSVSYAFSLGFVNETTGAYGGTYTATESNGHVNGPSPWSAQAISCQVVRPVEVEPLPHNPGNGKSCQRPPDGFKTSNPIIPATGEKVLDHQDYAGQGPAALSLTRNYRSNRSVGARTGPAKAGLGQTWSHNHATRLQQDGSAGSAGSTAKVLLASGGIRAFNWDVATSSWKPVDSVDALVANTAGLLYKRQDDDSHWQFDSAGKLLTVTQKNGWTTTYTYSSASTPIDIAPTAGLLIGVSNQFGRTLQFTYNASGQLTSVTAPGSQATLYGYDGTAATSRLTIASYPATTGSGTVSKTYLYENAGFPQLVTGVIDETGTRLATYAYDSQGRATSSQLAQGVELYSVSYPASAGGATTVTDPLGTARSYNYGIAQGKLAVTGADKPSGAGNSSAASRVQDANGFVTQETDFLGVNTMYTWDINRRLPLSTTKAAGLPEAQTSTTQWHATYRLPVLVTEAGRTTAYTYDSAGNTLSQTVTDTASNVSRSASWTYNPQGLLATETDAKGVVARSYAYYSTGNFTPILPPGSFDPSIQSVSLLLHGDGANGPTAIVDSSPNPKNVAVVGGAAIGTAQSKFGGSSLFFDGVDASNTAITLADSPDFHFPGAYTVEFWIRPSSFKANAWLFFQANQTTGSVPAPLQINLTTAGLVWVYGSSDNVSWLFTDGFKSTTALPLATWSHVALADDSTTARLFINGVLQATRATWPKTDSSSLLRIGGSYIAGDREFEGYLDDIRVTKGIARYTASFTPPAQAFPHVGSAAVNPNETGHMAGDLQSVTNAAGHVTQFTQYDRAGRVRQMLDPNGIVTDIAYTSRGWISTTTVTPPGGMARTTTYTYDNAGQVIGVVMPDATTMSYSYDPAHRLTGVTDAKGNTVTYTLDAAGNKTGEQVKDPSGNLKRNITRVYDALNRVQLVTGANN
jgi:YD repeat-containing protein